MVSKKPIFVLGYPRSGTSALASLVVEMTGYQKDGEGHVMPLAQEIDHCIRKYWERFSYPPFVYLANRISYSSLISLNIEYFRAFYHSLYPSYEFVDKTPGNPPIHGVDFISRIFPEAAFLCCIRSPVEVLLSCAAKFHGESSPPDISMAVAEEIIDGWVNFANALDLEKMANPGRVLEVDQLSLRSGSPEIIISIANHIGIAISNERLEMLLEFSGIQVEDTMTECLRRSEYMTLEKSGLHPVVRELVASKALGLCEARNILL
jgi:Sulfotransferase family